MIKHINTGIAELIAVKVPDDAIPIEVNQCTFYFEVGLGDNTTIKYMALPDGDWNILGIAHELTEDVWDTLIKNDGGYLFDNDPNFYNSYPDFELLDHPFDSASFRTATESGLSLLEANEVYAVNPYGEDEPEDIEHLGAFTQMMRQRHREWKKCQQTTGKWVLLKKIEL